MRFFSTVELVHALEQEKAQRQSGQIAHWLAYVDLVILDALGYQPFSAPGGALPFHLRSKLYERTPCGSGLRENQQRANAAHR
ncbi:ATP-binding protein [Acidovorax sp. JHL-9]|uniref:ATP-binding protein n=1 Tax=Acidovorax sp. JHL-9 TaxID=1276756 RepID=UPI00350FA9FB